MSLKELEMLFNFSLALENSLILLYDCRCATLNLGHVEIRSVYLKFPQVLN